MSRALCTIAAVIVAVTFAGRSAHGQVLAPDALKCQTGLAKGLAKFKKTKIKLWSKCLDTINKGGTCDQSAVNTGIGTTAAKVVAKVGSTCTDAIAFGAQPNGVGYAMNCQLEGTTPPLEAPEQACFNLSVTNVSQLVSCLICWHEVELDEWLHVVYPCPNPNPVPAGSDLECGTPPGICPPTTDKANLACLAAVSKAGSKFLLSKEKVLEKCKASVAHGRITGPCPDAVAATAISKAETKATTGITSRCPSPPPWWDQCPETTTEGGPCTPIASVNDISTCVINAAEQIVDELALMQFPTTTTTTTTSTTTTTTSTSTTTVTTTTTTTSTTTTTTHTTTTTTSTTTTTTHTTTTTTTTSTTTTTTFGHLSFTTALGTTSCGAAGLTTGPSAPVSGELDSNTACSTKIVNLGLGCLYFGGGKATIVPPGLIPDQAQSIFAITAPGTLGGSAGTSFRNCTLGDGPGHHCINGHCSTDADCNGMLGSCVLVSPPTPGGTCAPGTQATPLTCTTSVDCGGCAGCCGLDANCYFGPPLPIVSPPPNDALTTCVENVIVTSATGTFNATTGASNVSLPLGSRVFITGNSVSPCPKCISGTCDTTWMDVNGAAGEDNGAACAAAGALMTTYDCRAPRGGFQAELPVNLTPLTTATASKTATDGRFCVSDGQTIANAGAFGKATALCVKETGTAAGNISTGAAKVSAIAAVFCVPKTGNVAVDGVAALPGPGAIGLNGVVQLQP